MVVALSNCLLNMSSSPKTTKCYASFLGRDVPTSSQFEKWHNVGKGKLLEFRSVSRGKYFFSMPLQYSLSCEDGFQKQLKKEEIKRAEEVAHLFKEKKGSVRRTKMQTRNTRWHTEQ